MRMQSSFRQGRHTNAAIVAPVLNGVDIDLDELELTRPAPTQFRSAQSRSTHHEVRLGRPPFEASELEATVADMRPRVATEAQHAPTHKPGDTLIAVRRQLVDREKLLFRSQAISAGEMATALAHELNQPIGTSANLLRGLRSRLARRGAGLDSEESSALDRAIEQVMFAARVITRMRESTVVHRPRQGRVDLAALLRSSASLLEWDARRMGVAMTLDLPSSSEDSLQVRGDEVMLQQVVVNLMRNGLDAMRARDAGADTAASTSTHTTSAATVAPRTSQAGVALHLELRVSRNVDTNEAQIQVCDNGCGLSEEAAANLFVPYSTTKAEGMGVGLSICRSFVELHDGRLWFSRNAERGTTFHISLPLLAARSKVQTS